jgi:hypothetical protein
MKTKLFWAILCIFLIPVSFTTSSGNASSQFSAYASGWISWTRSPCECDPALEGYHPDCVCDATLVNPESNASSSAPSNLGSESLLILAGLMLWLRLRA